MHAAEQIVRNATVATLPFAETFPSPEYAPANWFTDPIDWVEPWRAEHGLPESNADSILRLTVTDEGRCGGYFYEKGVCIVDGTATMQAGGHDCWMPEPSPSNYGRFHQQDHVTDTGQVMLAGCIGNVGGHASPFVSHDAASAKYANPNLQLIICRVYDDDHGGYLAGAVVPGVTFGDVALLRRCTLSGDWRWFQPDHLNPAGGYDCLGPTLVTRPGLALIQAVRAASADHPDYMALGSPRREEDPPMDPDELTAEYLAIHEPDSTVMLAAAAGDAKTPYGNVDYADPGYQKDGKKRYPLDTAAHVKAAWSYINQDKNAAQYSADQVATIKGKIKAAAKKVGVTINDAKAASAMDQITIRLPDGTELDLPADSTITTPDGDVAIRTAAGPAPTAADMTGQGAGSVDERLQALEDAMTQVVEFINQCQTASAQQAAAAVAEGLADIEAKRTELGLAATG